MRILHTMLRVGDLEMMSTYYSNALAMEPIEEASRGNEIHRVLGRGTTPMVKLVATPGLPAVDPRQAGLFHTAFLYEDQASLAATVAHAAQNTKSRFVGSSDHLVSEAFYFTDPEGNGIELYRDRERSQWSHTDDGEVRMDSIYLAADPDREGEAICWHLKEELEPKKPGKPEIHRVMFNEITANAVKRAFEHPLQVNVNLVEAQQTRRVLDRIVGYQVSPLLWDKVRRGLSAGRVQTVALRLIVEREREIKAFDKKEYWTIDAHLAAAKPPAFDARFVGRGDEKTEVPNEEESKKIVAALEQAEWSVRNVEKKERRHDSPRKGRSGDVFRHDRAIDEYPVFDTGPCPRDMEVLTWLQRRHRLDQFGRVSIG